MTDTPRIDRASRVMNAGMDAAYRALVDPAAWQVWLPPEGMTGRIEAFEARAGGRYRMVLTYDRPGAGKTTDEADVVEGEFTDLVPNVRVEQRVRFRSDDPRFAGEMTMVWTVQSEGEGVRIEFRASNVPEGISAEDHRAGLRSSLDNLAAYLER